MRENQETSVLEGARASHQVLQGRACRATATAPGPSWPLDYLHSLPQCAQTDALGDHIARHVITNNGPTKTLLDCLCNSERSALWSPDLSPAPLGHATLRNFVANFTPPISSRARQAPLQRSDRVMLALPTGPENALMLMAIAAYHTCSGTVYAVRHLRALGATVGEDCAIWADSKLSLQLIRPELVAFCNKVSLDDCSVVAHIKSRGRVLLNTLRIGDGCVVHKVSRLLSGATMEPRSMMLEHTLVASGEIAKAGAVYAGWPARQLRFRKRFDPFAVCKDPAHTLDSLGAWSGAKAWGTDLGLPSVPFASKSGVERAWHRRMTISRTT